MRMIDYLMLINRASEPVQHTQDEQERLLSVGGTEVLLERQAAYALEQLMERIDGWRFIVPVSGWRSGVEQKQIWEDSLRENGMEFTKTYVALPGHSEHESGLAIDLGLKKENIDFIRPDFPYDGICGTFRALAPDYGFIERYPKGKEKVTGIGHEPWHFRYVGTPHARRLTEWGLVLEEYVGQLPGKGSVLEGYKRQLSGKEPVPEGYERQFARKEPVPKGYERQFTEKGSVPEGYERQLPGKESVPEGYERQFERKGSVPEGYERQLPGKESVLEGYERQLPGKESVPEGNERQFARKEPVPKGYERQFTEKEPMPEAYERQLPEKGFVSERHETQLLRNRESECAYQRRCGA